MNTEPNESTSNYIVNYLCVPVMPNFAIDTSFSQKLPTDPRV